MWEPFLSCRLCWWGWLSGGRRSCPRTPRKISRLKRWSLGVTSPPKETEKRRNSRALFTLTRRVGTTRTFTRTNFFPLMVSQCCLPSCLCTCWKGLPQFLAVLKIVSNGLQTQIQVINIRWCGFTTTEAPSIIFKLNLGLPWLSYLISLNVIDFNWTLKVMNHWNKFNFGNALKNK